MWGSSQHRWVRGRKVIFAQVGSWEGIHGTGGGQGDRS
jgi:hypothetical protein